MKEETQFIHSFHHYWTAMSAEGQGMVFAFVLAALRVIYDSRDHNWRRDVTETLMTPLFAYGGYKGGVWLMDLKPEAAIPIAFVVAIFGVQSVRRRLTRELDKRFPR